MELVQLIFAAIGTVLAVLFLIKSKKGEKYEEMLAPLDDKTYPLNSLYGVGFTWMENPIFKFEGKKAAELKGQAGLIYERRFADYYARVAWAQAITLGHMLLAITFLITAVFYDTAILMLVAGLFLTIIMIVYCMDDMKNKLEERTTQCERELPEVASTMAVLVNSGMMLREAWSTIAENGEGAFYDLMNHAVENMNNGLSETDALTLFGRETNSGEIKKFTSALVQNIEKGGGDLGFFLAQQSSELWNMKRQKMLQQGEVAATKLLVPIVLIFVGIIIIVMTAAFAGSLF